MTENPKDKPQIEIVSDEDWKQKVKEEDARLDAATTGSEPAVEEIDPSKIPAASLPIIIQMLSMQAMVAMGVIATPNGQTTQQLPLARHFIDLLAVLETKCQGNMTPEETKLLDNTLHELRMMFVELSQTTPTTEGQKS